MTGRSWPHATLARRSAKAAAATRRGAVACRCALAGADPAPAAQHRLRRAELRGARRRIEVRRRGRCAEVSRSSSPSRRRPSSARTTAIPWHGHVSTQIDWEVELAVIIGREGRDIAEADALTYVFGYTVANDVTARDLQSAHQQWYKGKGLDGFCPLGPAIVTADEIPDPQQLRPEPACQRRREAGREHAPDDLPRSRG